MAPATVQRAAFQKYSLANAGTIKNGKFLNIKYKSAFYGSSPQTLTLSLSLMVYQKVVIVKENTGILLIFQPTLPSSRQINAGMQFENVSHIFRYCIPVFILYTKKWMLGLVLPPCPLPQFPCPQQCVDCDLRQSRLLSASGANLSPLRTYGVYWR